MKVLTISLSRFQKMLDALDIKHETVSEGTLRVYHRNQLVGDDYYFIDNKELDVVMR